MRRGLELTADELHTIDGAGIAILTPSVPRAWPINQLRLTAPVTFSQALELAERHLSALPYRHVFVEHEPTGRRLADAFAEAGWRVDRELLMALAREPEDPTPAAAAITHGDERRTALLMARWHGEEHPDAPAEELRQVAEFVAREGRAWNEQQFVIAEPEGEPMALTKLRRDGRIAQVEDVYTVPEARGRGFARTLVHHAVTEARRTGHEIVFIVADDQDWPKHLYGRIGFDPIGRMYSFHRQGDAGRS
jgi:predicted GNAT family acetyltransferase